MNLLRKDEQQRFKTKYVKNCFDRIAKVENVPIFDCHMMEDEWFYRNKVQLPCGNVDGHLVTGFYKQQSPFCIRYEKGNLEYKKTKLKEIKVNGLKSKDYSPYLNLMGSKHPSEPRPGPVWLIL